MAAPCKARNRERQLLARLERRLDVLADTLDAAPVADKGMDVVREIKEVHALLHALKAAENGGHKPEPPSLVVVWADAPPEPANA